MIAMSSLERQSSTDDLELSVVMPCLNEARTVGCCVRKAVSSLRQMQVKGEVIVADNGSTDGSREIATSEGARVVSVSRRGYGSALQAGIESARGRYVIMGDADDSYDFSKLEPFMGPLRQGNDLVMGNRFKGGIRPGAMPWSHRYIGNPVLTGILNLFFHSPIRDAHCGLRGFRKDAYRQLGLITPGMEFASEMVVKACLNKQRITEVPVILHRDGRDRPPHLRSFRDGWRHLRFMLLFCPFWLYLLPSSALFAVGLALMTWLTPGPQAVGSVVFDIHTMLLGALSMVLGYQSAWLWAHARIHLWITGVFPMGTFSMKVFQYLNLERGLILGVSIVVVGIGFNGWLVKQWLGQNLGPLDVAATMRCALWGFTAMMIGVQTIYGSFFLGMLRMAHERIAESQSRTLAA